MNLSEAREAIVSYLKKIAENKSVFAGIKGNTFLSTGFVYAPYVPLQVTPTFLYNSSEARPDAPMSVNEARRLIAISLRRRDSELSLRKGIRTQYSKKRVNPNFYGNVTIWEPKK